MLCGGEREEYGASGQRDIFKFVFAPEGTEQGRESDNLKALGYAALHSGADILGFSAQPSAFHDTQVRSEWDDEYNFSICPLLVMGKRGGSGEFRGRR